MTEDVSLEKDELIRYDRQIRFLGVDAQKKLKRAKVLGAGVGGLGCPASLYLAAAGVGKLILVDREVVELSNLNRQILYWTRDVGRPKVEAASEKLRELNPDVDVEALCIEINEDNVLDLVKRVDLVIDGMDNWRTRFLMNSACVRTRKPFIHAGIYEMYGQLLVIIPRKGPCLQCIVPEPLPEIRLFPVLGTTPGVMAMLQVTEAIKIITGYGSPLIGKMIIYNGYDMQFEEVTVNRRPDCPICGEK